MTLKQILAAFWGNTPWSQLKHWRILPQVFVGQFCCLPAQGQQRDGSLRPGLVPSCEASCGRVGKAFIAHSQWVALSENSRRDGYA